MDKPTQASSGPNCSSGLRVKCVSDRHLEKRKWKVGVRHWPLFADRDSKIIDLKEVKRIIKLLNVFSNLFAVHCPF